jgi:hypothetical protein
MRTFLMMFLFAAGCAKAPILPPVNFQTGTTDFVNASDAAAIDDAAKVLETSDWSVIVLGLADASGDAASNKALSQARADAVAVLLREKSKGVAAKRIVVHAIGEKLAVGSSVNERKVEFIFFEDKGLPIRQVVEDSGVLDADFHRKAASK